MLILAGVAIAAVDMQMGYLVEQEMQLRHIKMLQEMKMIQCKK